VSIHENKFKWCVVGILGDYKDRRAKTHIIIKIKYTLEASKVNVEGSQI
jgi:hypothetical protein